MTTQPRVTYNLTPVVEVIILGEGERGPHTLNDGGLVGRFLEFQRREGVYPAVRGGMSGPGRFCGYFTAEDAEKIEVWLEEQGARRDRRRKF